jgi:hypothetical protein
MNNPIKFDSVSATRMIFDMFNDFTNVKNIRASYSTFICSSETLDSLIATECVPAEYMTADCGPALMGTIVNICYRIPFGIIGIMDLDNAMIYDDQILYREVDKIPSLYQESPLYKELETLSPLPGRFLYDGHYFAHLFPVKDFYDFNGKIEYV